MDGVSGERVHAYSKFLNNPGYILAALVVAAFLIFHRGLLNEYTYDGTAVMTRLSQPRPVPLSVIFQPKEYGAATGVMSWRPLSVAGFIVLDRELFDSNPALSHALNILIHAINAWLLLLSRRLQMMSEAAIVASFFFLAHPLVSEVVLCAGFRFDLLALMFALLTVLLGVHALGEEKFRAGPLLAAAGAFLLAMASKENAVIALVMAPACVMLVSRNVRKTTLMASVLIVTAGVFALAWRLFQYPDYTKTFLGGGGRLLGMENFAVSFVEVYFKGFLLPWPLRIDHDFVPADSLGDMRVVRALFAVALLVTAALALGIHRGRVWVGALWIACGFAPVAQLIPIPDPVAERFCYIPMAGAALLAAEIFSLLAERSRRGRALAAGLATLMILLFSMICVRRSFDWKDDVALNIANWEQANDTSAHARTALAALYISRAGRQRTENDTAGAVESERRAESNLAVLISQQNPATAETLRLCGVLALMRGDREKAAEFAHRAMTREPGNPQVLKLAKAAGLSSVGD